MAKSKVDGYSLVDKMRKVRRRLILSATDQALYNELIAICNEEKWTHVFSCSNDELCAALKITENTLEKSRKKLIEGGLIYYQSGKSKRAYGQYSFLKMHSTTSNIDTNVETNQNKNGHSTTSKFEANPEANNAASTSNFDTNTATNQNKKPAENGSTVSRLTSGLVAGSTSNFEDYNTESKTKTKTSKSHSGDKAPVKQKKEPTEHWAKLVDVWFVFYGENFKNPETNIPVKPKFGKIDGEHLREIIKSLKKLADGFNYAWTEEYAARCLLGFLKKAFTDNWLKTHFELKNLNSNFNSITHTNQNNGTEKTGTSADRLETLKDF
jgi:predicted transcriptional regulator